MFADHQPQCAAIMGRDPAGALRGALFVLATIREKLIDVADEMSDGSGPRTTLWGQKLKAAYWHTVDEGRTLHRALAKTDGRADLALFEIAKLPGFGPIKAGFVVQLAHGTAGCLDTHNLRRLNIGPNEFTASRFKKAGLRNQIKMIDRYLWHIDRAGGTEALWDGWCGYVAANQPSRYRDAEHVSALHPAAIAARTPEPDKGYVGVSEADLAYL